MQLSGAPRDFAGTPSPQDAPGPGTGQLKIPSLSGRTAPAPSGSTRGTRVPEVVERPERENPRLIVADDIPSSPSRTACTAGRTWWHVWKQVKK